MRDERLQTGSKLLGMLGAHVDLIRRVTKGECNGLLRPRLTRFQVAEQEDFYLLGHGMPTFDS
jgi:hypothetical protein